MTPTAAFRRLLLGRVRPAREITMAPHTFHKRPVDGPEEVPVFAEKERGPRPSVIGARILQVARRAGQAGLKA